MSKFARQFFLVIPVGLMGLAFVCQAQTPPKAPQSAPNQIPPELFSAGPIEPLRDMAGEVTIVTREKQTINGALIGLDASWVVIRIDYMNDENKHSEIEWIPVANIQRMIQTKVYPERRKPRSQPSQIKQQ